MSFDNCCKLLAEKYPERFASWLLGQPTPSVEILKTELSIEPIRADSVILLQTQGQILHLEFQTKLESDPPLPLRLPSCKAMGARSRYPTTGHRFAALGNIGCNH